jgi:mevalonate kinase
MKMAYKASAPGSLMVFGEYAVLQGKPAIVCAVDKRIAVTVAERADNKILIHSPTHGNFATTLADLIITKPFQFVLGTLKQLQSKLKHGYEITIVSEFSDKMGLGSSAAVTVALLTALAQALNLNMTVHDVIRQGRMIVRHVQGGLGSGADIAASTLGGMVAYQTQPLQAEKIAITHPMTLLYAGFKTPTAEAIKMVQARFATHASLLRSLMQSIGQCGSDAIIALRKQDWQTFGELMKIQQGLMEALGVNMPVLREMVEELQKQPMILGAKISGSGLGDCVLGLGEVSEHFVYQGSHAGVIRVPVNIALQGVYCEKI